MIIVSEDIWRIIVLPGITSIQWVAAEIKKRMLTLGDMAELKGWALSIGRKLPFILSVSILCALYISSYLRLIQVDLNSYDLYHIKMIAVVEFKKDITDKTS